MELISSSLFYNPSERSIESQISPESYEEPILELIEIVSSEDFPKGPVTDFITSTEVLLSGNLLNGRSNCDVRRTDLCCERLVFEWVVS